jgi:hypothetical protein
MYSLYLCGPPEANPWYYAVPDGNLPRKLQEFAGGWGGAGFEPGLLVSC